jgi:PAS domain S-box-containing protein
MDILVVEDSPTQAELLRYLLEEHSYGVAVAANGIQALEYIDKYLPSLVISDIIMPEMNGYELCRRIKAEEKTCGIPVILLTSLTDSEGVLEGLACGADNFLTKPFNDEYLLSTITQINDNKKFYKDERVRIGVEIKFAGKTRFITADQQQMLSLLISTYEAAVSRNRELIQSQNELRSLNDHLEDMVAVRTASLSAEIAERKRTEVDLFLSRQQWEKTFDAISDIICVISKEYEFIAINDAGVLSLKFPRNEIIGRKCFELVHGTKAPFDLCPCTNPNTGGESLVEYEKEGRYYSLQIWPVSDTSGNLVSFVHIVKDITESKKAMETLREFNTRLSVEVETRTRELREIQEQLIRKEKLAVLGQIAGGVGHELRNPLAVISNAIYFLKSIQPEAEGKIKEYLAIIQKETNTADMIINDLLDFARVKSVDLEPVAVLELVQRVLIRYPPPDFVSAVLTIPANLPKVFADPRQIEQVLGNLLLNAYQAMTSANTSGTPGKGSIVISGQSEGSSEKEFVAVSVCDTGVGIPPENMSKLFEPLFTTRAKGIGLGLAVSRKMAEANGGRIEVASEVGKGSTFTMYLRAVR